MKSKAFWGILLIFTAISLILYGIGAGPSLLGLPMHKLIFAIVFVALIISKIIYSDTLREKLKIFVLLSFLFMVLEPYIATWFELPDENIINNWLLLFAAILINFSVGMLLPKKNKHRGRHFRIGQDGIHIGKDHVQTDDSNGGNTFNSSVHYADVSDKRYHYYKTNMGSTVVYYQNAEVVEDGAVLELELVCNMGSIVVNAPADWNIVDEIKTNMGSTVIRGNAGDRVTLKVKGSNQMGSIVIE